MGVRREGTIRSIREKNLTRSQTGMEERKCASGKFFPQKKVLVRLASVPSPFCRDCMFGTLIHQRDVRCMELAGIVLIINFTVGSTGFTVNSVGIEVNVMNGVSGGEKA